MSIRPCPRCATLLRNDEACPSCRPSTAKLGAVALLGLLAAGCGPKSEPPADASPEVDVPADTPAEEPEIMRAIYGPPPVDLLNPTPADPIILPEPTDADDDGSSPPDDCDDSDADIHPGADDLTADGVDQNCDGVDGARPEVEIRALYGMPRDP